MKKSFVMLLMMLGLAGSAWAAGDVAEGQKKAAMCAACHGANGISVVAIYPNLAGQKEAYLVSALKAYKSQERKGGSAPVMWGLAAGLSDQDMENLAAYFASLNPGG